MKKIFYLLLTLVLTACTMPQSPLLKVLERKSGLIAFIGVDGNIYVSDQAGGNASQITKDGVPQINNQSFPSYQSPTWSHDSASLAFIRLDQSGDSAQSKIFVTNMESGVTKSVYSSAREHPYYLNWSPDDSQISFLSTTAGGQNNLLQSVPATGGERVLLDAGQPFYWSWAPDSKTMLVHKNGAAGASGNLSFLKMEGDVNEYMMKDLPASFQAPAWSPNGEFILYSNLSEGKQQIVLADSTGNPLKTINTFDLSTAFVWSFDSTRFAYIIGTQSMQSGALGDLHIYDIETEEDIKIAENVLSFFWSPESERIAYFVPFSANEAENSALYFQMNMFDVKDAQGKELFTFQPTPQFVSIMPYFDQYHQSTTIWSPDGNNIVLSFISTNDGKPGIAVVAPSGNLEPRILAQGVLAFWSWK